LTPADTIADFRSCQTVLNLANASSLKALAPTETAFPRPACLPRRPHADPSENRFPSQNISTVLAVQAVRLPPGSGSRGGRVRFALLAGIGDPVWDCDPGDDLIETAVARAVAHRG